MSLSSFKFLHAMILRIRHIKILVRIQRHGPRISEPPRFGAGTANDLDRFTVRVENLNPAVAKLQTN